MRVTLGGLATVTGGLVTAVALTACSGGNSNKPTVLPTHALTSTSASAAPGPATAPASTSAAANPSTLKTQSNPPDTATPQPSKTTQRPVGLGSPSPATPGADASVSDKTTDVRLAGAGLSFIKDYYKTAAKALTDKQAFARWETMFLPTCDICNSDLSNVSKSLGKGYRYDGGGYTLVSAKVASVNSDDVFADIRFYVTKAKVYDSSGHVVESDPQSKVYSAEVEAAHLKTGWALVEMNVKGTR